MKVYIGHSRNYDYEKLLYQPVRGDIELAKYDIILPHESTSASNNSREFYQSLDLFIAEVSYPATGLGIELGWAFDSNVPIYCIYRTGTKVSGSLHAITDRFYEYEDLDQLTQVIREIIDHNEKVTKK